MVAKVRYLSSAGIHHSEVKGLQALAEAFPSNWLIFASLNAFPKYSAPIEIDVMVVMDDRVVLLELKDWNGPLKAKGDMWIHGKPHRSPVVLGNEKAKKLKAILRGQIPQFGKVYFDSRVVLTGSSTRDNLSAAEKPFVLTLSEAKSLADKKERDRILGSVTLTTVKPNMLVKDIESLLGNSAYFQPRKMSWDGYNVTDEDFYIHRSEVWREHRAQLAKEERVKALLRLFRFDNLPVGLNEPKGRRLIADRELKTLAYLSEHTSWMAERGVLKHVGAQPDEVLTEHYQLLGLPPGWTTLRRYIQRNGSDILAEQRVDIVHTLTSMVAELHYRGVSHRDIGDDAIWLGTPTTMALTGFFSSRLPDDQSVSDYLDVLGTYAELEPNWECGCATAQQRDVRSIGLIMQQLAALEGDGTLPSGWTAVAEKAVAAPIARYNNARELADAIGELRTPSGPTVDQSRLDELETTDIPYVSFQAIGQIDQGTHSTRYLSNFRGEVVTVKIWNGILRGNASRDHALLAMLESASQLECLPQPGVVPVFACGLSPVGPFVVTKWIDGTSLSDWVPTDPLALLTVFGSLVASIRGLHDRDLAHGDLHPKNVIVSDDLLTTLIDLMDISPIGSGRVRSTEWAPEDHERRSDQQIDRFAACRIVLSKLEAVDGFSLPTVAKAAKDELSREAIETLQPLVDAIDAERERLSEPPPRSFVLSFPGAKAQTLAGDDGHLWVRMYKINGNVDAIWVTGISARLFLRMSGESMEEAAVEQAALTQLGLGKRLRISLSVVAGPASGGAELVNYLKQWVPTDDDHQVPALPEDIDWEEGEPEEGPEVEAEEAAGSDKNALDVARMWLRVAEIEEDLVLQVRLDRRVSDRSNSATYEYASTKPIEFEDEDTVEVRLGGFGGRLIGFLDVPNCDYRRLAIRDLKAPIAEGEYVSLLDRRDRVSKERRRRAVERITRRSSVVPNIIDYFDSSVDAPQQSYETVFSDEELSPYRLNSGQKAAFRALLATGPVGLLQGPPGSGKTKFIASFAHWLLKSGGARRLLIASQSHEAVNNVLEELLKTFRFRGGHADLLRIGSRGATERIRPYQARSLRERYRVRFENGLKTRVAQAASAAGIPRQFVHDVADVDLRLGRLMRSIELASAAAASDAAPDERRRSASRMKTLMRAFAREAKSLLGRDIDENTVDTALLVEEAYAKVLNEHPKVSPGDLGKARQLVSLANEWNDTLLSGHRNFDEFLAKTRRVVAGTCVGLGQSQIRLDQGTFDWVIIDEAARCTSGELAVPLQLGSRVVLVGDQRQLRPMVDRSVEKTLRREFAGSAKALAKSDFERAFESSYGRRNAQILDEQYRMDPVISDLVSDIFYAPFGVKLKPSEDRIPDPAFRSLSHELSTPVVWFDTAKMADAIERERNSGRDIWNDAEISTVISLLHRLAKEEGLIEALSKRSDPSIGIICMYSEQKRRIEREWSQQPFTEAFRRLVVIDTVDAYQGKENEIIILTLVRSNGSKIAGHVGRENRCNVALSRAKERLYIVGDTEMWSSPSCNSPMFSVLLQIKRMKEHKGKVRAAGEILDD